MKVSAKIQYACLAIVELGFHWPSHVPLQIATIAGRQKIPIKFLTQIMVALKHGGYVESMRGKSGGYVLTKAPADIHLSEIVKVFGGFEGNNVAQDRFPGEKILNRFWKDVDETLIKQLDRITFEEICASVRNESGTITFVI